MRDLFYLPLHEHDLILEKNKVREDIAHKIVVFDDILEISCDGNQSYDPKFELMKCVTYMRAYNLNYTEPQAHTILS